MKKKLAIFAPLGLIGVIVIAFLTYLAYFAVSGRALPNAHIGQLDVGGMTKAEIVTELTSNVDTAHAMISGQGINDTDANLSDMGAHLDIDATVKRVLSSHRSVPLDYFTALFSDSKVDPIVTFPDEDKLQDFARSLTEGQNQQRYQHRHASNNKMVISLWYQVVMGKAFQFRKLSASPMN